MTTDWPESLEIVVTQTGNEHYRALTAEDHPDHVVWRRRIIEKAGGDPPEITQTSMPPPASQSMPPVSQQAVNLFRSAVGFARSGFKLAPKSIRRERQAECDACPLYDAIQRRCRQCGCATSAKVYIAADACPLVPPKWKAVT